jgi:hypothetical protein
MPFCDATVSHHNLFLGIKKFVGECEFSFRERWPRRAPAPLRQNNFVKKDTQKKIRKRRYTWLQHEGSLLAGRPPPSPNLQYGQREIAINREAFSIVGLWHSRMMMGRAELSTDQAVTAP